MIDRLNGIAIPEQQESGRWKNIATFYQIPTGG
jgi:hypothetical protein